MAQQRLPGSRINQDWIAAEDAELLVRVNAGEAVKAVGWSMGRTANASIVRLPGLQRCAVLPET